MTEHSVGTGIISEDSRASNATRFFSGGCVYVCMQKCGHVNWTVDVTSIYQ